MAGDLSKHPISDSAAAAAQEKYSSASSARAPLSLRSQSRRYQQDAPALSLSSVATAGKAVAEMVPRSTKAVGSKKLADMLKIDLHLPKSQEEEEQELSATSPGGGGAGTGYESRNSPIKEHQASSALGGGGEHDTTLLALRTKQHSSPPKREYAN